MVHWQWPTPRTGAAAGPAAQDGDRRPHYAARSRARKGSAREPARSAAARRPAPASDAGHRRGRRRFPRAPVPSRPPTAPGLAALPPPRADPAGPASPSSREPKQPQRHRARPPSRRTRAARKGSNASCPLRERPAVDPDELETLKPGTLTPAHGPGHSAARSDPAGAGHHRLTTLAAARARGY